jgi:hypothetical protein
MEDMASVAELPKAGEGIARKYYAEDRIDRSGQFDIVKKRP